MLTAMNQRLQAADEEMRAIKGEVKMAITDSSVNHSHSTQCLTNRNNTTRGQVIV